MLTANGQWAAIGRREFGPIRRDHVAETQRVQTRGALEDTEGSREGSLQLLQRLWVGLEVGKDDLGDSHGGWVLRD